MRFPLEIASLIDDAEAFASARCLLEDLSDKELDFFLAHLPLEMLARLEDDDDIATVVQAALHHMVAVTLDAHGIQLARAVEIKRQFDDSPLRAAALGHLALTRGVVH